jgi:tetratricopeptide (TPR) repeat protein
MTEISTGATAADPSLRQQLAQGFDLLRHGRLDDALRRSEQLLARHAGDAQVLYFASEVRTATGDADAALALITAAIAAAPGQAMLQLKKARILVSLRRRSDARQEAKAVAAACGNDGQTLWAIGGIYSLCDDPIGARDFYLKALAAKCDHPALLYDLAAAQFFTGDFSGAEHNLAALLALAPRHGPALYLRATLRRQSDASNHIADLNARLLAGFSDISGKSACLYALAKELEDLGQSEKSFAALTEATALKRSARQYDAAAERSSIEAIRAAYTQEVMQAPTLGHDEEGAIFIVGMPRTGTTLVERMLGRHSEVGSAGELRDFGQALASAARKALAANPDRTLVEVSTGLDFAALGRDYMTGARQAADDSRFFIDKMPINYIYCGLIRKALPKARIIHLVRDPMDSCYAVHKTLFNQSYPFSCDLEELADYYATYHRQMQHWHTVMPGAIIDVHYEDLVTDFETQARRVLAWCGLEWQDAVLTPSESNLPSTTASAAQVREPVHARSVGKWRSYESGLAPLKARLLAAGIPVSGP